MLAILILLGIVCFLSMVLVIQHNNFYDDVTYMRFEEIYTGDPDTDVGDELNDLYITDEHEEFLGVESHGTGSLE